MNEGVAWIIEQGDYSGYHVVAVCLTEEEAERVCERLNTAASEYDQFSFSERPLGIADDILLAWRAKADNDYSIGKAPGELRVSSGRSELRFRQELGIERAEGYGEKYPGMFYVEAWAETEEQARKIAQDRWYQLRAEYEGLA